WSRQRVRLGLPLAVLYAWLAAPTRGSLAVGSLLAVVGLIVRGVAASSLRKHETLVTSGLYAVVRHPLYLGSIFIIPALFVAAPSLLAAAIGALYFALFYPAAVQREEQKLQARYGAVFDEYATRVPRFVPRLAALRTVHFEPSLALYRRNGEYRAAIGVLIAV